METKSSFSDDIRRYVAILWQRAWLLVLAAALAGGAAFIVSKRTPPTYATTATVMINEASSTARSADYSSVMTSERLAQTYAQIATKQKILNKVAEQLGESIAGAAISVSPVRDTQLVDVRVVDTDKDRAVRIANALVNALIEDVGSLQAGRFADSKLSLEAQKTDLANKLDELDTQIAALADNPEKKAERDRLQALQAQYRQTYTYLLQSYEAVRLAEAQSTSSVVPVESAVQAGQVGPRTPQNTILATLVGLMLAVGVVFLIEALDDTIRTPDEIQREIGAPVLGWISSYIPDKAALPITADQPRSPVAEAFRSLRTNIQYASVDHTLSRILITSPSPADGKSTVAVNLGIVLAQGGSRVAVLDCDLRRPTIHKHLRLANRRGVSDLFVQPQLILDGALQKTEVENLFIVPSGTLPPNPSELLGSDKMREILNQASQQVDTIILDAPPVLAVTDAVVLASRVDGVLLVIKPGETKRAAARQSVELLHRVGANILGVVLNGIELKRAGYYRPYYYAYHHSYHYQDEIGDGKSPRRNGTKASARKAR